MKTLMRGAAIGLALALGAQAAQAQAGLSLGLGAGAVVPTGSMADVNSMGWSGQASLRVKPAVSPLGFQVDAFYSRSGWRTICDGHSRLLGGTANAVFAFPSAAVARPYLIGGLGLYNGKTTLDGLRARPSPRPSSAPTPVPGSISSWARPRCTRKAASTRSSRARSTPRRWRRPPPT